MKILFVVEHFYPYVGGAEELFLNLAASMAAQGHDVDVVTTSHDNSLADFEVYRKIKITRVRCKNRFYFTILGLAEVFRKAKNADFIHTTSYNSAIPSFIAGLFLKKKVLITFHEVWGKLWFRLPFYPKWKLTAFYLFEWLILKLRFHRYIAVSKFTMDSLISAGVAQKKIEQIYNGIDYEILRRYTHTEPECFTFCFFGRLGISKGIDLLLDATKTFTSNHPEAKLKLIIPTYPDSLFQKVKKLIRQLDLEKSCILLHNLSKDELLLEVSNSSCVVIPSASEGFCFVAVESAAMGVPVISSGKGSLPEVTGGKHLIMDSMTSGAINNCLEKAFKNEWNFITPGEFSLAKSMEGYDLLYKNL